MFPWPSIRGAFCLAASRQGWFPWRFWYIPWRFLAAKVIPVWCSTSLEISTKPCIHIFSRWRNIKKFSYIIFHNSIISQIFLNGIPAMSNGESNHPHCVLSDKGALSQACDRSSEHNWGIHMNLILHPSLKNGRPWTISCPSKKALLSYDLYRRCYFRHRICMLA